MKKKLLPSTAHRIFYGHFLTQHTLKLFSSLLPLTRLDLFFISIFLLFQSNVLGAEKFFKSFIVLRTLDVIRRKSQGAGIL